MKHFILILGLLLFSHELFSFEIENVLVKELVDDFHQSVEEYNKNKKDEMIEIKFDSKNNYKIQHKKDQIDFTVVDVLKNQFYFNGKKFHFTKVLNNNGSISFFKFNLIESAEANDLEKEDFSHLTMSAGSTKVLLSTLGEFTKTLSKISWFSFDPCVTASCINKRREDHLQKLIKMAETKNNHCEELKEIQTEGMEQAKRYLEADYLPSINNIEFSEVKNFLLLSSKKTEAETTKFLSESIAFKARPYRSCIQVILSGTIGDNIASSSELGKSNLGALGGGAPYRIELYNNAGHVCEKLESLRNCIVDLNKNISKINTLKRSIKKSNGEYSKPDPAMNTNSISK